MSLVVRDGFIVISYIDNKTTFQMAWDTNDSMRLLLMALNFSFSSLLIESSFPLLFFYSNKNHFLLKNQNN